VDKLRLLDEAATVNSQLVSLPRVQLMQTVALYGPDGIEFRELQASMGMSDGKLLSNLYALRDLGVLEERKAKVENKTVTTYTITDAGRAEWQRTRSWLLRWLESP
jgi:DNA-binding PadR family transcriptional regulator